MHVENAKTLFYQSILSRTAQSGVEVDSASKSAEISGLRGGVNVESTLSDVMSSRGSTVSSGKSTTLSDNTVANMVSLQESQNGTPIDKAILQDLEQYAIKNPTPEMIENGWRLATEIYIRPNIPSQGTYAEVKANDGRVIARIDNSGAVESDNSINARLHQLLRNETAEGPQLAEQRARKIAQAFGGSVDYASSAKTQQEWQNRPPVTWSIDIEAMKQHGYDVPPDFAQRTFSSSRVASEALMTLREKQGA